MGQRAAARGALEVVVFSASFILLEKMRRSVSMSLKPAGGGLRLEEWRMAGIVMEWDNVARACYALGMSSNGGNVEL
jgi:hypothetical protein